jgi:lipopolysaccharide export system permease protein
MATSELTSTTRQTTRQESFFKISVMDRYLASELWMPFLFGVGAFSSVGLALGSLFELIRMMTDSGLELSIAAQVLMLKLPNFIGMALPMATLLAALLAYSRLSSDSELMALRSCGVSVYRLVVPAILMSLLVTGITFAFHEVVVPAANYRATMMLQQALKRERPAFREENILHQEFRKVTLPNGKQREDLTRLFYAKQFDGQNMKGLTILDFSQDGLSQIIAAKTANWNVAKNRWDFHDGTIYPISTDGSYRSILRFKYQQLQLPRTPLDLAMRGRDVNEMTIAQSLDYLKLLRQGRDERRIRKLEVRIQQRYAFPFICLVFGLVGVALGIRSRRTSRATGFGVSIMIIFLYYLISYLTGALGINGTLSPELAAWLPTVLGLGAGGFLLVRAAQ